MTDASLPALAANLALSMGVVIALMLVAAKLLRRAQGWAAGSARGGGRGGGPLAATRVVRTPIDVATIQPLTRNASVALVRAAGRELVVGVTDTQVTLLHSGIEPRDHDLDASADATTTQTLPIDAARIAALMPGSSSRGAQDAAPDEQAPGRPAWTDALETLRARTARR